MSLLKGTSTIGTVIKGISSSYTDLTNKPQINNVELTGNKSLSDIGAIAEPASEGTNGQVLTTNGSGTRTWTTIQSAPSTDDETINLNSDNELQTIGVINTKTSAANRFWSGTLAEYNAIETKDANTFYSITDDTGAYVQEPSSEGTNGQVLTTDGNGGRTWTTVQSGSTWGSITGTLSSQTDLNTALTNKVGNDTGTNTFIYKVWYGTLAQYTALATKDTNTLYFIPEE